jgi:hypothetical protein
MKFHPRTERHHDRRPTTRPAAASAATSVGPERSTMMAIKANASNAKHVSNVLTANAAQSHPN